MNESIIAKFSTRTKALLFSLLVVLVVILHYPISFNEIGWDSFAVHIIANSLSEFGYAKWWLHPLSVFGMYPYSMSSALPFLLSGTSQLTGMSGDINIFWTSLFLGILSIFTAYLMAGVIFDNDIYKFLVALSYSTSQGILFYTTWTAGMRALFIVLAPLFIYTLIKSSDAIKYVVLSLFLFLLLDSTHKMYYFLLPIIFSFVVVHISYKLKLFPMSSKRSDLFNYVLLLGFVFTFMIPFFTRTFIEDGSRYEWLTYIILSYIRYTGIAILFVAGGYVYILLNSNKNKGQYILLVSLVFLAPLLYILAYMKWFIIQFFVLLSGMALYNAFKSEKNLRLLSIIIVSIVIFSAYFQISFYIEDPSIERERSLDKSIYAAATWSNENVPKYHNMVSVSSYTGERMFSISEVPTMIGTSVNDFTYGFVNESKINIIRGPLSFGAFFESLYVSTNKPKTSWYFDNTFLYHTVDDSKKVISLFNFSYMIENTLYNSVLLSSLHEENDRFYDNGKIVIWDL